MPKNVGIEYSSFELGSLHIVDIDILQKFTLSNVRYETVLLHCLLLLTM